jgi:hypothetical protein
MSLFAMLMLERRLIDWVPAAKTTALLAVLLFVIAGCAVLGPAALKGGRTQYNTALNDSSSEELLLNIVRLRHSDQPYFLQVSSISATSEATATLGGSEEKGALGGIGYLERPNIIYIPLAGDQLVTQLLTPVDLSTLRLLRGAGWEFDDILRVFVKSINGFRNATTAASATPEGVPEYVKFLKIAGAIDELEDRGMLGLSQVKDEDGIKTIMLISPAGRKTKWFQTLVDNIELDPQAEYFSLDLGVYRSGTSNSDLLFDTRPILASMFYLGQSIEFPPDVISSGIVNVNYDKDGEPFDWGPVFKGLMSIKVSRKKPDNYFVAVDYKDLWYFVENTDISSKETLSMLSILISLKAGGKVTADPILTLPVGG